MKGTKALKDLCVAALIASEDVFGFDGDAKLKIAPIKSAFTFTETMVLEDIELADFNYSAPRDVAIATTSAVDPVTGDLCIRLTEPAGGFEWATSSDLNLPQTITGFALLSNDEATLLGVEQLATPITLTASGQFVDFPQPMFRVLPGMFK